MNFAEMRAALQAISAEVGEGYLVSCSWDGSFLQVTVGRRAEGMNWRKPWVMTFDSEDDYLIAPEKLIADLARGAKVWFS